MAEILLNVKLVDNATSGVQNIQNQLAGLQVPRTANVSVDRLQKSYANLLNTIRNTKSAFAAGTFDSIERETASALHQVKGLNAELKVNESLSDQNKKEYAQLKTQLDKLGASFATTRAEAQKLDKSNKLASVNIESLRKRYLAFYNSIKSAERNYAKGSFDGLKRSVSGALDQIEQLRNLPQSEEWANSVKKLDSDLTTLQGDFEQTRGNAKLFHGSLLEIVGGFTKFQLAAMIVMKPIQLLREAFQELNEVVEKTENAVVAIQRTLSTGEATDTEISTSLYSLAAKYGQTFENVQEVMLNFSRAGYSWEDTLKATEAALTALNVAELDAGEASDGMIAIMKQFGVEASDLTSIIDKLNKTSDNYAVTTEKLLEALQRTGSSARNANLSLEETVGIVTALSEATGRSGSNLGTAINALIQYSTKSTALETFARLDSGTASAVSAYREGRGNILDVWREVARVIQTANETQRGMLNELANNEEIQNLSQELHDELGDIFETTQDVYGTANTFRKNYFIALLGNMDTVQNAIDTARDSIGYSQDELDKYLDTFTAKSNTLKATWDDFLNRESWLNVKKFFADAATWAIKNFMRVEDYINNNPWVGEILAVATKNPLLAIVSDVKTWIARFSGQDQTEEPSEVSEEPKKLSQTIKEIIRDVKDLSTTVRDDLVEALKDLSDIEQDSYEWEEKKLAVLEAQNALYRAQRDLSVRVLDENGTWTRTTDEKAIAEAEKSLQRAQYALEQEAYSRIIDILGEGGTNESITSLLAEIEGLLGGGFAETIANLIKSKTGVDIYSTEPSSTEIITQTNPKDIKRIQMIDDYRSGKISLQQLQNYNRLHAQDYYTSPVYDNGGVLNGLGGIKATSSPEVVLSPALTEKILNPSSNGNFTAFAKSLGLLFGASENVAKVGEVCYNNVGGSVTNNNGNTYTVNGISISRQEAETKTIAELFDTVAFLRDN